MMMHEIWSAWTRVVFLKIDYENMNPEYYFVNQSFPWNFK